MQYAILLSSPPCSALSKHTISSMIEITFEKSTLLRLRAKEIHADRRSARQATAVVL